MKKWKILFWGLLLINFFTTVLILFVFFEPFNGENPLNRLEKHNQFVEVSIETHKADLNQLINHYLQNKAKNQSVDYQVILKRDVELIGALNIFDSDVKFEMSFAPEIQENGDMILRQKSMSLGMIQLPVPMVLKYVKKHYSLPKWVSIQPDEQTVYVSLKNMKMKGGFKVKVKKFDLLNDEILFKLAVPLDKS